MANISTRMVILLAAAGLSLAGTADAAFADPQPGYSDSNDYDENGAFNDGYGYDKNGAYDDGSGYTDSDGSADGNSYNCYDNGVNDAYGSDNCGWHDGYFYPGFGIFVFDRHHHRHEMSRRQHDYFTRQAQGPDGKRRVGVGSSGGIVPPTMYQPRPMPRNGGAGARTGFGGSHGGTSGGFRGGGHRG